MNDWPPDAPSPQRHEYRMFTGNMDETSAAIQFENRYGQPPEYIVEWRGWLYVGPIPEVRLYEVAPR